MRKIADHMGMPISIDIPGTQSTTIFEELFAICEAIDERFSPFKTNSELSRFWRGLIKERDLSSEMQEIIADCNKYEKITEGYFSAHYAGRFNPTGYVKSFALKKMANYLDHKNINTYMINAGGDIVAKSKPGHTWKIAVTNPMTKQPLAMLDVDSLAVATSGTYEKGTHIYDPHTKEAVDDLTSVKIFGPDIIKTDVFATAVFAMGNGGYAFMKKQKGYPQSYSTI
jgi:FAD:protein FMN transferase